MSNIENTTKSVTIPISGRATVHKPKPREQECTGDRISDEL